MMTNAHFQALHDRATRGEQLNTDEQAMLDAWYIQEDATESAQLNPSTAPETATQLRNQVAAAVAQLETISQQIRTVLAENDQVRHEIIVLQGQLALRTDRAA